MPQTLNAAHPTTDVIHVTKKVNSMLLRVRAWSLKFYVNHRLVHKRPLQNLSRLFSQEIADGRLFCAYVLRIFAESKLNSKHEIEAENLLKAAWAFPQPVHHKHVK